MSRSSSPRAPVRDWPALLEQARQADRQLSPEELDLWRRGLIDGTANGWHVDLVHALQRAIEARDHADLIRWLDARMPIPAFAAPLIADAFRLLAHGTTRGRPKAFTAIEDADNRDIFDKFTHREMGMSERAAVEWLARATGRSLDTVRRSLRRTAKQ